MQEFVAQLSSLAADDDGVTLAEYAILLALVAMASFVGLHKLGNKLHTLFQTIAKDIKKG